MTDRLIIVDNNMLSQLYSGGGRAAWNTLLSAGDRVVITEAVQNEARRANYSEDFDEWRNINSDRIDSPNYSIQEINSYYSHTRGGVEFGSTTDNNFGDYTIRYYVESGDVGSNNYVLASSDRGLINYFSNQLQSHPFQTVFGFLVEQARDGRISLSEYDAWINNIRSDPGVLSSIPQEYRNITLSSDDINSLTSTPPTHNILGLSVGLEILRQAGVAGDIFGIASAAAQADELMSQGRTAEAEQVWASFIGGTAGGIGLAAAGGAVAVDIGDWRCRALIGLRWRTERISNAWQIGQHGGSGLAPTQRCRTSGSRRSTMRLCPSHLTSAISL